MPLVRKSTLQDGSAAIPRDIYTLGIIEVVNGKSKKGAAMLTLSLQILAPATVPHEGKIVKTAGRKFKTYLTCSEENRGWVNEIEQLVGTELPEEIDTDVLFPQLVEELTGKVLLNVELDADPYFEQDAQYKPILTNGQKTVKGYGIKRVANKWTQALDKEAAGLA